MGHVMLNRPRYARVHRRLVRARSKNLLSAQDVEDVLALLFVEDIAAGHWGRDDGVRWESGGTKFDLISAEQSAAEPE